MRAKNDPHAEFRRARLLIHQRIDEMIERTLAEAKAFEGTSAWARAIEEIVEKGRKIDPSI